MRIPLSTDLESRDGLLTKDAIIVNGFCESDETESSVFKRPGNRDIGLIKVGVAQLLTYWNGLKSIINDFICVGSPDAAVTSTTWNPSDKGTNVVLSNGNLTVGGTATGSVRSVVAVTTGQWYYETTIVTGANSYVGMANSTMALTGGANYMGSTNNSIAYYVNGIYKNAIQISAASYATGDVIGILRDISAASIAFYKNGVLIYTATGANVPSGSLYAAVTIGVIADSVTTNFGATTFIYSPGNIVSTNLSPTTAGLQFSAQDNGSSAGTQYLMFKNATQAWTLTNASGATPVQITDVDYPGTYTVTLTSLTRTGTVATATTATDTNFQVGSTVTLAGATPSAYNGAQVVTGVTASSVTTIGPVLVTLTRSSTTATAVSVKPHGFSNGQSITIAGALQTEYNGSYTITWISTTSFSFTVATTGQLTTPATGAALYVPEVECVVYNSVAAPTIFTCLTNNTINPANGDSVSFLSAYLDSPTTVANVGTLGSNSFTITIPGQVRPLSVTTFVRMTTAPVLSTLTSLLNVATVTTTAAHKLNSNAIVSITNATPSGYNYFATSLPSSTVVVTSPTTFTYSLGLNSTPTSPATGNITATQNTTVGATFTFTIAGSPATPATGTITAAGGRNTARGIAYLNGYFAVMDIYGVLYNSAPDDPSAWNALEFTAADSESGAGVALAQLHNYIFCFKQWSTEPFYDRQDTQHGSPFSRLSTGFTEIGCASGDSLAQLDGALIWMAQTRQNGRSIYVMQGTQQTKISTPDIDRVLKLDDLANVRAWGMKISGHGFYVLSLVTSNLTLIYDQSSGQWGKWTTLTLDASKSVTSITLSGTTATVTVGSAHGLSDGDPVTISGAVPTGYNGINQASYVSTTVFTVEVAAGLTTPATGTILAYPYTESYYKFTHFANALGRYMTLHTSNGHLYEISPDLYQDAGIPIPTFFRTIRMDGGSTDYKGMSKAILVADKVSDTMMIRWSDDDSTTFTAYRPMTMSDPQPQVRRSKEFRRRSIEMKHTGNNPIQCTALELEVK